jgi:Zn-dependent alcohol dehydrogenases
MRAWVQEELGGPMTLKEVPEPVPGPGEVLLEVEAVGLPTTSCGSGGT